MSTRAFRSLLCLALLLLVQNLHGFAAQAEVIEIGGENKPGNVNVSTQSYVEEAGPIGLAEVMDLSASGAFEPVTTIEPDFGYIAEGIWLKLDVRNVSDQEQLRFLMLHTNFMSVLDVYLVTAGARETLLQQDQYSAFGTRPVPYHELIAPLTLAPGQTGTIYVRYTSNGNTVLPLSLVDSLGLATTSNRQLTKDFSFYGLMLMVIILSILGRIFFPNPTFVAYGVYVTGVLMLIFQRDGYAFQFLWPDFPRWNDFASLPLGASLPLLAAIFTRYFLKTKTLHPNIDKVLIAIGLLQIAVVAGSPIIGVAAAKQWALTTVALSIVVFIGIGVMAFRRYGRGTIFYLIGWIGLLAGTLVMNMVHWFGVDITRAQSLDVMRVSIVFEALMMGLAVVFSVINLQRDNSKLAQERLQILDTNVRLHDRFARLEQKYQLVQEIAKSSSENITDLTHDLRQPLFALRASISEFASSDTDQTKRQEIASSFEYIESLVENALNASIESEEAFPDHAALEGRPAAERTRVNDLFASLEGMFGKEAGTAGIDLEFVPSDVTLAHAPFPLLRIIANFLSNAIHHAPGSQVTVGCEREGDRIALEVRDSGAGIPESELDRIKKRLARGEEDAAGAESHGVGLSIVSKIATEHSLEWSIDSADGRGTVARLIVPID